MKRSFLRHPLPRPRPREAPGKRFRGWGWGEITRQRSRLRRHTPIVVGSSTMSPKMQRREFITLLGSAAAAWPLAALGQQPAKLPTVGLFGPDAPSFQNQLNAAFVQRLHELGWFEGRTVAIAYRFA